MLENHEYYQDILNEWGDLVYMKNPYQFGEEIDMEKFTSVLKQTYEWICELKGKIISGQSNADEMFAFSKLISVMSQYIPDTCTDDESENHLFTVTCMLTEALLDFATSAGDIKTVEGETIVTADGKNSPNKIMYHPNGMITVYKIESTGNSQFSAYNDGFLTYDFNNGDYSEFVNYANSNHEDEDEEDIDSNIITEATTEEETKKQIEEETGMVLLEGFLYNPDELAEACNKIGLNEKAKDLNALCQVDSFKATYLDLKSLADSGLVHMYYSKDNWDVERLSDFITSHPYLYVELSMIKETNPECPPYKIILRSIETLSSFYFAGRHAEWINLVTRCVSNWQAYYIESEKHEINELPDVGCSLRAYYND